MFSFNIFEKLFGVLGDELVDTAGTGPGFAVANLLFSDGINIFLADKQSVILLAGA